MKSTQRAPSTAEPVRFEERGPLAIAGLGGRFTLEARTGIPELWKHFAPHIGRIPGQVGQAAYGISSMRGGTIDYIAGVEVADGPDLPDGFSKVRQTATIYAVFEHRGHVSTISDMVGAIINDWLPNSGWAIAPGPQVIERYGEDFDPNTSSGLTEILIPLKG